MPDKEIEGDQNIDELQDEECVNEDEQCAISRSSVKANDGGASSHERWADRNKALYGDKHTVKRVGGGSEPKAKGVHVNVKSDVPCLKAPTKENRAKYWKKAKETSVSKTAKMQVMSAGMSASAALEMIDTIDREGDAKANSTYARSGTFATCKNKAGERIPKAGAFAEAGVGEAKAEFSIFEAAAKGPNAGACAVASATGVRAMATAGIGTASAQAGPIGVKVGLSLDTGVSAGVDGIEAKFLGIGFSVGPKTSVSFLGNEVSCCIQ